MSVPQKLHTHSQHINICTTKPSCTSVLQFSLGLCCNFSGQTSNTCKVSNNLQGLFEHHIFIYLFLTHCIISLEDDPTDLKPSVGQICFQQFWKKMPTHTVIYIMCNFKIELRPPKSKKKKKKKKAALTCKSNGNKTCDCSQGRPVFWDSLAARKQMTHCGLPNLLFVFLSFIPYLASLANLNMRWDACLSFSSSLHQQQNRWNTTHQGKIEM